MTMMLGTNSVQNDNHDEVEEQKQKVLMKAKHMQQETNTYKNPLLTPNSTLIYKRQYVIEANHLLTRYNGCSHLFVGPGQGNSY
jgi:hypothetical protein